MDAKVVQTKKKNKRIHLIHTFFYYLRSIKGTLIDDKAKELDPEKKMANWGYNRYQAYYGLYGEEDPRTKAAEADR